MFFEKLKKLRMEHNLSQEKLASILGYSRTAISAYELGRNEPSFDDLKKIATYFNVSTDYLLGKEYPIKFENKLRYLLLCNSYSPSTIANEMNISTEEIKRWLNGTSRPTSEQMIKLAKLMNVTVDYLLYEKNDVPVGHMNLSDDEWSALDIFWRANNNNGDYQYSLKEIDSIFPGLSNKIKKSISDTEATEILKRKFIQHGIIKEGEDLSDEQLEDYLKKLSTILNAFKD